MDKRQKELIKSYFYARKIAYDNHQGWDDAHYEDHEVAYLIVHKPDVYKELYLGSDDEVRLLTIHPELIDYLDTHAYNSYDIYNILVTQPQLVDRFPLDELDEGQTAALLVTHPHQFIDKLNLNLLHELDPYETVTILDRAPEFFERFKKLGLIDKFNRNHRFRMIDNHPEFFDMLDRSDFTADFYASLLIKHPELIEKIKDLDMKDPRFEGPTKMPPDVIVAVLQEQPHLIKYFDISKIEDVQMIANVLNASPTLKDDFKLQRLSQMELQELKRKLSNKGVREWVDFLWRKKVKEKWGGETRFDHG